MKTGHSAGMAIALGGLIAGTLDIGAAALVSGRDPVFVLHAIAGGVFGMASFDGGMKSAGPGLALQLAMSLVIATNYGSRRSSRGGRADAGRSLGARPNRHCSKRLVHEQRRSEHGPVRQSLRLLE